MINEVEEYINSKPEEIRSILVKVREIIRQSVQDAEESIPYDLIKEIVQYRMEEVK